MELDYRALLKEAYKEALKSKDPSTQNGAVLVRPDTGEIIMRGFNHFPEGFEETPERMNDRDIKYKVIIHAEEDVLFKCGRSGVATYGLVMVCPYAACIGCARVISAHGISLLVVHEDALIQGRKTPRDRRDWDKQLDLADEIMEARPVQVLRISGKLDAEPIRMAEELWTP